MFTACVFSELDHVTLSFHAVDPEESRQELIRDQCPHRLMCSVKQKPDAVFGLLRVPG